MSLLTALFDRGKIYNFEHAFGARDITTPAMQEAIKDWARLYYQTEPTKDEDPCQRIPTTIVSKLTKTTLNLYIPLSLMAHVVDGMTPHGGHSRRSHFGFSS